jgi:hypothetical protein
MGSGVEPKRLVVTVAPSVGRPVALLPDGSCQAATSWAEAFEPTRRQDAKLLIDAAQAEKTTGCPNSG